MSECRDARWEPFFPSLWAVRYIYPTDHLLPRGPRLISKYRYPHPRPVSLLSGDANDDTDATPVACPTPTAQYHVSPHHSIATRQSTGTAGLGTTPHYSTQETNKDPSRGRLSHGQLDPPRGETSHEGLFLSDHRTVQSTTGQARHPATGGSVARAWPLPMALTQGEGWRSYSYLHS